MNHGDEEKRPTYNTTSATTANRSATLIFATMPYTAPGVIFAVASSLLFYYGGERALYAYGPMWYDSMDIMGMGALWMLRGREARLGDGEVIPGGVWYLVLNFTSYFVWGRLSLLSLLIEYEGHYTPV